MPDEIRLLGGAVTEVVRVGDTVRRPPGPRAAYVRELLRFFEQRGWSAAPRYLGVDDRGRETLTFVSGEVPWQQPLSMRSDAGLARVAELMREFHDLTAGTVLAGDAETVCHNDLSPHNTVYCDGRPIAFIDWDIAAPGRRIHDIAHVAWQFLGLGPGIADPTEAARWLRLICDAYGLGDRTELIDTVLWWQDRCWRGIEAEAAAGDPAKRALLERGIPATIRTEHTWTAANRTTLESAL